MTGRLPQPGEIYYVGAACGVPFNTRPIYFQVLSHPDRPPAYADTIWIDGYELSRERRTVGTRRSIYVKTAGLRLVSQWRLPAQRSRNTGPVVAIQHTTTTTGRNR